MPNDLELEAIGRMARNFNKVGMEGTSGRVNVLEGVSFVEKARHMKRYCLKRGRGQLQDEVLDVQPLMQVTGAFGQGEAAPKIENQPLQLGYRGNYFTLGAWGILLSDKEDVTE